MSLLLRQADLLPVTDTPLLLLEALKPSIRRREFTRGVGPNDTVVLDIEALLGSGRFNVSDEA